MTCYPDIPLVPGIIGFITLAMFCTFAGYVWRLMDRKKNLFLLNCGFILM